MRRPPVSILVAGVVLFVGGAVAVAAVGTIRSSSAKGAASTPVSVTPKDPASPLEFRELLDPGPALKPSAKALALDGKRVRMVGFMAEMEEPIEGAFYLVPRPIKMDESGGGTGDLPLESVLVAIPGSQGQPLPHVGGALEGTGVLEVGNRADEHGHVSNFRLRLDPGTPRPTAPTTTKAAVTPPSTH